MSDPRLTPFNGRVAHIDLKGTVVAERFVEGEPKQVDTTIAGLYLSPDGPLDRELLWGQRFLVLDTHEDGDMVFGMAARDGYCGWVDIHRLGQAEPSTHRVAVRESYCQEQADLKAIQRRFSLFLGSEVCVVGEENGWSRLSSSFFVPSRHLTAIDQPETDPVAVARRFGGTPYVWGGNSGRGIDCSGLVQAALLACGIDCPGDSDLQERMPGERVALAEVAPGDLLFWKGHVAMVSGANAIIHANAHHMAVVEEAMDAAIARIAASETGPVTSCLRVTPPRG